MIIFLLLTLIGLGLILGGVTGVIVGLKKKSKKIWISSIVIPVFFWLGLFILIELDRKFIEAETEKNGGETPDWVW